MLIIIIAYEFGIFKASDLINLTVLEKSDKIKSSARGRLGQRFSILFFQ